MNGYIESVCITPDGKIGVSVNDVGTLIVWDLNSGECLRKLKNKMKWFYSTKITPDGKRAVSGSLDKTLRVWDLETGKCLRIIKGHKDSVMSVSITPDGKRAVSNSSGVITLWNLENGKNLISFDEQTKQDAFVSITPDARIALSGGEDNELRVVNLESSKAFRAQNVQAYWFSSVSITPDAGKAFSGRYYDIRVWNIKDRDCIGILKGHTGQILCSYITPDGQILLSGSTDNTIRVWDIETGECLRILKGHKGRNYKWVSSVTVTPDGKHVLSGSADETVRVWDIETGECLRILRGHRFFVTSVSVAPDGKMAISGGLDKSMRVWDLNSGECLRTLEEYTVDETYTRIAPDRERSFFETGNLIQLGYVLVRLPGGFRNQEETQEQMYMWPEGVSSICVTPDGKRAVSGSLSGMLRMWNLRSGECVRTFIGHTGSVTCIVITPDGKKVISGSRDKTVRVWDIGSGECLCVYQLNSEVTSISDITSDRQLVLCTYSREVLFATLSNLFLEPIIVTPVRMWKYGLRKSESQYDNDIITICKWCGRHFPVSVTIIDAIDNISRKSHLSPDQSSCLELPDEAWNDPWLLSECPLCHKPLRFNPFIVDNKNRYSVG